jgi:hypothetical protein
VGATAGGPEDLGEGTQGTLSLPAPTLKTRVLVVRDTGSLETPHSG